MRFKSTSELPQQNGQLRRSTISPNLCK